MIIRVHRAQGPQFHRVPVHRRPAASIPTPSTTDPTPAEIREATKAVVEREKALERERAIAVTHRVTRNLNSRSRSPSKRQRVEISSPEPSDYEFTEVKHTRRRPRTYSRKSSQNGTRAAALATPVPDLSAETLQLAPEQPRGRSARQESESDDELSQEAPRPGPSVQLKSQFLLIDWLSSC